MKNFYNIHNFIKVKIVQNKVDLASGYNHYLREFKAGTELKESDYEIHDFSDFRLPEYHFNVDNTFVGFENGACLPKEKYAFGFDGNKVVEYTTYANRATNAWIQNLLLGHRMSFIHGAGIEIYGKGLVFPAFGGTGKTMLISEIRKLKGFEFFGDDYVIVDGNSRMYSYPSDFSIYDYHVPAFPELQKTPFSRYLRKRKTLRFYYNAKRAINFAARRLTSRGAPLLTGWNADYVKVPTRTLIPKEHIGTRTNLFAGILLSRYSGEKIKTEEVSLERFVKEINGILHLELLHGMRYLFVLAAFGLFDVSRFEETQREIIEKCFANVKRYRVLIPSNMPYAEYREYMVTLIKKIIK